MSSRGTRTRPEALRMRSSVLRNILSNWFGLVAAALIGLAISPFVVHTLGKETYGLLAIVVSITGQYAILDLGVRNAIVKYTAQYRASGDQGALARLISSALGFNSTTSLLVPAITIGILPFFSSWFEVGSSMAKIGALVLLIYAADAVVELVLGLFQGVLAGYERYDLINISNTTRLTVNAACIVVVLKLGYGILGLAIVAFSTRLMYRVALMCLAKRHNPSLKLRMEYIRFDTIKKIARYGVWACVIVTANRLIYQVDVLVVGAFMGTVGVSVYAVAVLIVDQFRLLAVGSSTILTPRFSSLAAVGNFDEILLLIKKWATYGELLSLSICLPLLITGGDFIRLWMGKQFIESIPILLILTVPFLFTFPPLALANLLYARNEHKANAITLGAEALCNLALSIILVRYLGLVGVAVGTLIPSIISRAIVLPMVATRKMEISLKSYAYHSYVKCLPAAAFHCLSLTWLKSVIGVGTWAGFIATNTLGLRLFGGVVYQFYIGHEDRMYIKRRLGL
jgi:O-antigen/teichoic acid export membrane protein